MKVRDMNELKALLKASGVEMDAEGRVSASPEKAPETQPLTQELCDAVRELIAVTRRGLEENKSAVQELVQKEEPTKLEPVRKWVFTVERVHGEMSKIIAEAQ